MLGDTGNAGVAEDHRTRRHQELGGVNCQAGLLIGQAPGSAVESQLVNAVYQVAYGPPA